MKTNLELIKELPGIKFARQYTPQKDTRGEIFLVEFEPEAPQAPEGKKRVLFTNSFSSNFFEGDRGWWFHKPTFEILSRNLNYIDEYNYSEGDETSELYKTEAAAYRHMIRYAAKQGKLIEKNTDLGWKPFTPITPITPTHWRWSEDLEHPENVYRIAKKVKAYKKGMGDFKSRLIDEQKELEEKLNKLDGFLMSEKVSDVDDTQKALLKVQATAMNTYNQCLLERIERL